MSYLVFARKWRPTTFSEVVGQEHVTTTLENAIKNQRLASAYIFSGPRGVGKTTTARILAKALNCESGPTTTPCNECSSCREITDGYSMDVLEIDGASNRGIDEVRNLRESTRYTPAKRHYKIYIIDEVHMLTTEAFNALLKTLEEPPPHVIFIFATTEVNKVPPTILSRCQRFDFRRIHLARIVDQLTMICQHDGITIEPGALNLIGKKAEGCLRDGESLLDQMVSFCGTHIKEEDVIQLLGLIDQDIFFEITTAIAAKDVKASIDIAHKIYEQGFDASGLVSGLVEHLNNMLILKATASIEHLHGFEPYFDRYQVAAEAFTETDLLRMIQAASEVGAQMKRSFNAQLQLEVLLVKLARLTPAIDIEQIMMSLDEIKKKVQTELTATTPQNEAVASLPMRNSGGLFGTLNGTLKESADESAKPEPAVPPRYGVAENDAVVTLEEVQEAWPKILEAIKKKKISIGSFLEEGVPTRVTGNRVCISFDENNGFHVQTLNEQEQKFFIQSEISQILGKKVFIDCVREKLEGHTAHRPQAAKADEPKPANDALPQAQNGLPDLPLAKKLIEALDGEPVN